LDNHFLSLKRFRKIVFYALGLFIFCLITLSVLLNVYQDRIIQHVVAQANKSLKTAVRVDKIEVNWWSEFPNLSVVCKGVYVEDSHPETAPLFLAKRISFSFNLLELWRGQYVIQRISVYQSETFVKVDKKGVDNFDVTKKTGDTAAISFQLNRITLKDAWVSYQDAAAQQDHRFASDQLIASLAMRKDVYEIQANGALLIEQIGVGENQYLVDKDFAVDARVFYDDGKKEVRIDTSRLQQKDTRYLVAGRYQWKDTDVIDLHVHGANATVQSLLAFLPEHVERQLAQYESKGDVYFDAELKGRWQAKQSPALQVKFGWNNADLYHPEFNSRIEEARLEGLLVMPAINDLTRARLTLQNISGMLNGRPLTAQLQIDNFREAFLALDFRGIVAAEFVNSVYHPEALAGLTGAFAADLHYEGPLGTWARKAPPVLATGSLQFQEVGLELKEPRVAFTQLNGLLEFNQQDLSLSNFSGRVGASDFRVNGLFRNVMNYVANPSQPVQVEAELQARSLAIEELLGFLTPSKKDERVRFSLNPNWTLNFNCQVDHLRYKKFNAQFLAGDLQIRNQLAVSRNVQMKTMGGELTFNGIVDAQRTDAIDVVGGFQLNKVFLDSIFHVFENFDQTFVESKHLKGRVDADVSLELTMNEALQLQSETLIADVTATIRQGELNNFEPLQKLNRYLDDEGLSKLRFADLSNEIHIENQTVYIPQMEIRSNVTTIQLSGTHTFSQQIDYRIVAPLRNKKKIDPDEAFGAIEESKGQSRVFLKITGTTDKYEVSYDKSAVKQKMATDLKKEVKELKDAFRLKGKQKKKELELSEEEFDWQ
jgi:uncharacterized protein involved in outer membrane biogenesis